MTKKFWALLQPMAGDQLRRVVGEAEEAGLEGLWVPQLFSPPFPTMAAVAMASQSLKVGSGIALAFTRSPVETALLALDVDLLSGGRTVLGIGTSTRDLNERLHGATYGKPVEHLREVVRSVRDVIARGHTGELGLYEGPYHRFDLRGFLLTGPPVRKSIPIYLPALFESTIRLAGEVADGLAGHPMWTIDWVKTRMTDVLHQGLAAAGQKREEFHVNLYVYVAIAKDRRQAIHDARGTVAFYAGIAQYEKYFARHGFGDAARTVATAAARGDRRAMVQAVPDEMVESFVIAGTREEAEARIEELGRHADSITLIPPGTGNSLAAERVAEYQNAIATTFYPIPRRGARSAP